ncbi:unnamed protein product [Euphydryas editha]|uniref:Ras-related protein Rab-26 n=1 Tax=Euphydryas editha TaxID=104508 RepID=A0AAU9TKM8_EUPED|nr:unnamed protein product [Euphydryas editha]
MLSFSWCILHLEVKRRKLAIATKPAKHVGTDDSMSDDVFEDDTLRAPAPRGTPSPTGYRDYRPESPARSTIDDDIPIHKTILLGDSGVGKTSLLVQFETGKFQAGNFSATVGIGFTVSANY